MKRLILAAAIVLGLAFGVADAQLILQGSSTAPTCSGCGTAVTIVGGDQFFSAKIGANGSTPYTFTFSAAQSTRPRCIATLSANNGNGYYIGSVYESTTTVIVRASGTSSGIGDTDTINVFCPRAN